MGGLICSNIFCRRGDFSLSIERLCIAPGETIALLGENGCGKSTLLQILAGLLPLQGGKIFYKAARWDRMSPYERSRHASFLPQEAEVLFNLSVDELLDLSLHNDLLLQGEPRQAVLEAAELIQLRKRPYPSLSGGEKRRAMLARIFCRKNDLVFLDEPTAPLDMRHAAAFMRYAAALPCSLVLAMHDLNLAVRYCDRFLLMREGRILFDRRKGELNADELEKIYGIALHRCGDLFVPER